MVVLETEALCKAFLIRSSVDASKALVGSSSIKTAGFFKKP